MDNTTTKTAELDEIMERILMGTHDPLVIALAMEGLIRTAQTKKKRQFLRKLWNEIQKEAGTSFNVKIDMGES